MPNFVTPDGDLRDVYVTDLTFFDRYIGNQLWMWGTNGAGALGINDTTPSYVDSPIQTISAGTNWKQISLGYQHTAAIKTDGTLWLWGLNTYGALGDNSTTHRSSPVQTVSGGTGWKQVSCGLYHTGAIKTDGTLWMWGQDANFVGQLGDNGAGVNKYSPVQTIAGGNTWKQVACGDSTSAAIKTDGTLWVWGYNGSGAVGDNTTQARYSPVQTVAGGTNWSQVSIGNDYVIAIKTDGTLWTWGDNVYGQLGINSTTDRSSPVQTVAAGTNWKQVACGYQHVTAIKTDGTLWTWGRNDVGQLGTNDVNHRSSPVQTVAAGTNWKQAAAGGYTNGFSGAIKTDGTLWMWGSGNGGRLGDTTSINKSSPVQISTGGTNWKQVSCGGWHAGAVTFTES